MASQIKLTPCGAMFDIFKRAAHLSHIELCGMVLSSRPLADGRSPQSRAADRSWVSRLIVRAPVGTLQERYFADYGTSAALVLFVAVGCSADVRSSVTYAIDYAHATCGGATSTPRSLSTSTVTGDHEAAPAHPLGLLRVQNGYVVSAPRWIQPSEQGVEIGALATGEGDITDVGDDVSARHAHVWCDDQNVWYVEDLSSTNGTVVVNGATNVCTQVEPGRSAQLNPGDELRLGESTTYAILLGAL